MPKKSSASVNLDGWISTRLPGETSLHVRVGQNDGRIVVTDLMVSAPEVTTDLLRDLHPTRLLAWVASLFDDPAAPDTYSGVSVLRQAAADRDLHPDDDLGVGELRGRATELLAPLPREPLGRPDAADPSFYQRVAAAYRSAATESGRPAVVLAEENEVPVETVRRWVKEARRRGFLEAGGKGRAL